VDIYKHPEASYLQLWIQFYRFISFVVILHCYCYFVTEQNSFNEQNNKICI